MIWIYAAIIYYCSHTDGEYATSRKVYGNMKCLTAIRTVGGYAVFFNFTVKILSKHKTEPLNLPFVFRAALHDVNARGFNAGVTQ